MQLLVQDLDPFGSKSLDLHQIAQGSRRARLYLFQQGQLASRYYSPDFFRQILPDAGQF